MVRQFLAVFLQEFTPLLHSRAPGAGAARGHRPAGATETERDAGAGIAPGARGDAGPQELAEGRGPRSRDESGSGAGPGRRTDLRKEQVSKKTQKGK